MYNPEDSINTAYNYIQQQRANGYKYNGYGVYNVSKDDLQELKAITDKYGIPFEWVINLIKHESANTFNPTITNSIGATGLIQFMPSTAKGLGTTTEQLRNMTFKQQLAFVDKYLYQQLKNHLVNGKIPESFTQGDVFMTIFYPVSIGKPNFVFPQAVKNANSGISKPLDYVQRALKNAVFPLTDFPYTLADFKKKFSDVIDATKEGFNNAAETVKKNPIIVVGISFVICLSVGLLITTMLTKTTTT